MTKVRCEWCIGQDIYEKYHDEEWGDPVYEDQHLYELLLLESCMPFKSNLLIRIAS